MSRTLGKAKLGVLALAALTITVLVAASAALAAAPASSSPPTLDGTYREGSTLTTSNGLWTNSPTSFSYAWGRCDSKGNNCSNIKGETKNRYKLTKADVNQTVISLVTAKNSDGSTTANSKPTPLIGDNSSPKNTKEPTISGNAVVGESLTGDPGTWTGAPNFSFTWLQCDAAGSGCTDTGSRGKTYGVRAADLGRTLRVQVKGTNPNGNSTAISNATAVVKAAGGGGGGGGAAVPVSSVSLPDRLVISAFSSTAFVNRTSPVTMKIRVSDTRGRLVQGALVLAQAIPFGRVTSAPEVATDSNGIATVSVRATSRLELVRGFSVQFFLRARKPGDNILAGVSTRRLVQVPIR